MQGKWWPVGIALLSGCVGGGWVMDGSQADATECSIIGGEMGVVLHQPSYSNWDAAMVVGPPWFCHAATACLGGTATLHQPTYLAQDQPWCNRDYVPYSHYPNCWPVS